MTRSADRIFPEFSLSRLLKTVFEPKPGQRIGILIDLVDPKQIAGFAFLKDAALTIQRHAHDVFYQGLKNGVMAELGLRGGEMFAYQITGGSNLDLPDDAWTPEGRQVSLTKDVYPNFDILLCISTYSATAPLTAFAKQFGFRGATLHGVNPIILRTGLAVDYNEVSRQAEMLRLAMTRTWISGVAFLGTFLWRAGSSSAIGDSGWKTPPPSDHAFHQSLLHPHCRKCV